MQLRNQPLVIGLCDEQYVVSATPPGVSKLLYLSFYRNRECFKVQKKASIFTTPNQVFIILACHIPLFLATIFAYLLHRLLTKVNICVKQDTL